MMLRQNTMIIVIILVLALTLGAAGCGQDSPAGAGIAGSEATIHPSPTAESAVKLSTQPPATPPPVRPHHYGAVPCYPFASHHGAVSPPLVRWSPNGTHVLFGLENILYLVDSKGLSLRKVTDANPLSDIMPYFDFMLYGLRADISPDGSQVVYTSCEYPTQKKKRDEISIYEYPDWRDDPVSYTYEIAISNVDGTGKRRLTENLDLESYPLWSPDGERIAVMSSEYWGSWERTKIYTMDPDGSDIRTLVPILPSRAEIYPHVSPKWSPDGERIAFLATDSYGISLYTAEAEGSNLRKRIAATHDEPSWSPDSRRLAFLVHREDGLALRTAAADGSDIREIGRWDDGFAWKNAISWSPSGSELMLIPVESSVGTIFVVGTDGSMIGQFRGDYAEWSPDGSRIAVFISKPPAFAEHVPSMRYKGILLTIAPDGTDIRVLAKTTGGESSWVAVGSGEATLADRIAQCETDAVVPNHADNPGLVEDCKTLLTVNSTFREGAANWGADKPITEWGGILVREWPTPPRVVALRLWKEIVGPLRPEIAKLSELRSLAVYGGGGPIPPEWGQLSELRELTFAYTITAGIPPELGNLENLETLRVRHKGFLEMSECVPESLVRSLEIGQLGPRQSETWDDFETIEDLNARIGTELKPC